MNENFHAVTGAYGYSGKCIAQRLLREGFRVKTLTNSKPAFDPFEGHLETHPLAFEDPEKLSESLRGTKVLYNTYWVRFNSGGFSYSSAVENTKRLFEAAKAAGVERIVHVSITNPSVDSPFEYFRRKAELECYLKQLGLSYAILRPAVFFGKEDILINNIAWMLRRFPVYGLFGDGGYGIRPIHVEDFATLAVEVGRQSKNLTLDAVGPESFKFRELVETLGKIIDCPRPIINIPPWLGLLAGNVIGLFVRDIVVTREEISGLMAGLLTVDSKPLGKIKLTEWAKDHKNTLGQKYASELARRHVK
jgi:uncharacterized protein YbjT (DUF2867 family)